VLQNENTVEANNKAFYTLRYSEASLIDVSVPTKLIFAAFEPDKGVITAPNYEIINNSADTPVNVSITGLTETDMTNASGLTLTTADTPGTNQFNLYFNGKVGADTATATSTTDKLSTGSFSPSLSVCTLGPKGSTNSPFDTYFFTLAGKYVGSFDIAKYPVYAITFTFTAATT
jgi:hypothetical protein